MRTVSLGFSCQTRFSIDDVCADHRRMPFDYVVTTRDGLLRALDSRGEIFQPDRSELAVFTLAGGREGPAANGVYFWHDYPADGDRLAADWSAKTAEVGDKYRFLWTRFESLLLDPHTPKRLVLSNTQAGLTDFVGPEAFDHAFGLTSAFYHRLVSALDRLGARRYEVVFLNRSITDTVATRAEITDPRFSTRFGGVLALPTNPRFAFSALGRGGSPDAGRTAAACGSYEGGWRIEASGPRTATVFRDEGGDKLPIGELFESDDGFMAMLAPTPDQLLKVVLEEGDLLFFSPKDGRGARWRRA